MLSSDVQNVILPSPTIFNYTCDTFTNFLTDFNAKFAKLTENHRKYQIKYQKNKYSDMNESNYICIHFKVLKK